MANHETEAENKPHDGRGNVVYSRRLTAEERARRQEEAGADARTLSGGKVSLTLPTLLAGFVLLLALVYGLGYSSVREMQAVSERVREESQMRSGRTKLLLELNNALAKLNNEARERDSAERRGGIINPFDLRLRTARGDVRRLLASFERLPAGQTDAGQQFRRQLGDYIGITEDLDRYSLEGFALYRNLDEQLDAFIQQTQAEQENLNWQSQAWENEAQSNLDYLTILAVLTGIFVAGVTTWEVQRRFRQVRRSLTEARRERQFNAQMIEGMVSAVAAIDAEGRIRSANESFQQLLPEATVGASVNELRAGEETTRLLAKVTAARVEEPIYH
ncbi:MAG: PAS domain-containing protein, partial [Acidobacteriota bacterium]|nr:PAS domain-containing protein [Acidobacteriota bacterium]